MKKQEININGKIVTVKASKDGNDYISLTDMARYVNITEPRAIVQNWLRVKYTIEFIGNWEILYNLDFKRLEFEAFKSEAGSNSFFLSPEKWIKATNAIGITTTRGRYGGGTFAHKDIAFEFATWISPEFKLYLIKEFQRLKSEETQHHKLDWSARRMLTKINYKIHTDSIKENILIPQEISGTSSVLIYASEADLLNMALFGMTAKDWKTENPTKEGNIRDHADIYQLICLSNLESLNSEFIQMGIDQSERLLKLNKTAITQMRSLLANNSVQKLE